mmetsp:Transcript_5159/g.8284  ORF Transcript_5159/g.8284 Transcript_5159/m.8284 type:complete len:266 (-) Transcript_5159:115-912(-)
MNPWLRYFCSLLLVALRCSVESDAFRLQFPADQPIRASVIHSQHQGLQMMAFDTRVKVNSRNQIPVIGTYDEGYTLDRYMRLPVQEYVVLDMPMNSDLIRTGPSDFELRVPPLKFLWMEVIPTVYCQVTSSARQVQITSEKCLLGGSDIVEGLNEAFKFKVCTTFSWIDTPSRKIIMSKSDIDVEVQPPGPFALVPKAVLEKTGDTVMRIALNQVEKSFISALAKDYLKWANSQAYREERTRLSKELAPPGEKEQLQKIKEEVAV